MFFIKKLVSRFFFPVPLCLELLILGLALLWFTKRQKTGKVLVSLGAALLALLSHGCVADALLGRLESRHPAWHKPVAAGTTAAGDTPQWVVVLGGGYSADDHLPLTARPSRSSLARLVEGIWIQKQLPGSRLVLSVGAGPNEAEAMTQLAMGLGAVPNTDTAAAVVGRQGLVLVQGARDTEEELVAIERIVGTDSLVLVTSASHLPRAMALARSQGLRAVPAPADHLVTARHWSGPQDFFPDASALARSERAFYEYLGLAWAALRGRTVP